mgnify:CR=1 FL=1
MGDERGWGWMGYSQSPFISRPDAGLLGYGRNSIGFVNWTTASGLRSTSDQELRLQVDRNRLHICPDGDLTPPESRPECP